MEPRAKVKFIKYLKAHGRVNVRSLHVHNELSYLGASPDLLVYYDCCGETLVEIKSPMPSNGLPSYIHEVAGELKLKTTHQYYTQVQGQLAVTSILKCFFFVYMKDKFVLDEIQLDKLKWLEVKFNLEIFFCQYVAPELVYRNLLKQLLGLKLTDDRIRD